MSEPQYKLGDDGELEEIFDNGDEKPKRKPKLYNRTLHVPLRLMLLLVFSIVGLVVITFGVVGTNRVTIVSVTARPPVPTSAADQFLSTLVSCHLKPITQKGRFAFSVGPSNGPRELARMDTDGTNMCRLTENDDVHDDDPQWSHDGNKIAFVANTYEMIAKQSSALYVMNADGENRNKLVDGFVGISGPHWSPNDQQIIFTGQVNDQSSALYSINADGTNQTKLTEDLYWDRSPDWSPDGQYIVFSSNRSYQSDVKSDKNSFDSQEIYVMDKNGHDIRRLTNDNQMNGLPLWSPDGLTIAFMKHGNVYLMDKNGQDVRALTHHDWRYSLQMWAANGKEIGYSEEPGYIQFYNLINRSVHTVVVPKYSQYFAGWWPLAGS